MKISEKIIFIMLILLTVRIVMIMYSTLNTVMTELFKNKSIGHTIHFKRYIENISSELYFTKTKTNTLSKKEFISKYLSLLTNTPYYKKSQISLYTRKMRHKFIDNKLENIANTPTNYIMSKKDLEMSLPYTLDNYIVFNEKYINKLLNHIDTRILETFIHEKLHTIQRLHQKKFNEFYKTYYPFLYKIIPLEDLPETLKKRHMTNPDNNFDLWLYKINNITYIPILEKTEIGLQEYAYEYKNLNNSLLLSDILTYSSKSQTHPNELFAYEVAEQIMNKTLKKNIYKFLKNLKF